MSERTGSCLCGAVRVRAEISRNDIGACHCQQCQRWTGGGPLLSVRTDSLGLSGEEHIQEFRISEWGVRAFCRECGSNIYWRMADAPPKNIAVGLLDDQTGLKLTEEIFVDCRAPWMSPVDGASQSTETEQLALLDEYMKNKKDG